MSDKSVNFQDLIKKMKEATVTAANRPTILGGQFAVDRLGDFLAAWRGRWGTMDQRIWEHISFIEFADKPKEPQYLQRAEIFGEGGHLSLRRDGSRWLWHYVGDPVPLPLEGFAKREECENFWTDDRQIELRRYDEQVILWGKRDREKGHTIWWEDRVAAANLDYPNQKGERVYLDFWRYTQDEQTVFVRYRKLSSGNPADKQGGYNG